MAFNPDQYKTKKKRNVNPDIPRPNLMSHEKKLKDNQSAMERLLAVVAKQEKQILQLQQRYTSMQASIDQLLNLLRGKG